MGHTTRTNGIRDFWPDDTDKKIYIARGDTLENILADIAKKWPGVAPVDIKLDAEHIHTSCLGYDCYDSFDYTTFITISIE